MEKLDRTVANLIQTIDLRCQIQNEMFGNGSLPKARFNFTKDGVALPKAKRDILPVFIREQIEHTWQCTNEDAWRDNRVYYIVFIWELFSFKHAFTGELRLWHPSWQESKYQLFLPIPRPS